MQTLGFPRCPGIAELGNFSKKKKSLIKTHVSRWLLWNRYPSQTFRLHVSSARLVAGQQQQQRITAISALYRFPVTLFLLFLSRQSFLCFCSIGCLSLRLEYSTQMIICVAFQNMEASHCIWERNVPWKNKKKRVE